MGLNIFWDYSDEKLIKKFKITYDMVYNIECYSVGDIHFLSLAEKELTKRGYKITYRRMVDVECPPLTLEMLEEVD